MIAFVKGELDSIETGLNSGHKLVVENGGIGFEILVPLSVLHNIPSVGSTVKIYTYTYVREDVLQLYGFLSRDELAMFKLVITVNGIGPKGALAIFSIMDADKLRFAILSDDAKEISKAQGIGIKMASKLILELKDKCNLEDMIAPKEQEDRLHSLHNNEVTTDAIQALVALGYSSTEAAAAVKKVTDTSEMSVEELLKASLKKI